MGVHKKVSYRFRCCVPYKSWPAKDRLLTCGFVNFPHKARALVSEPRPGRVGGGVTPSQAAQQKLGSRHTADARCTMRGSAGSSMATTNYTQAGPGRAGPVTRRPGRPGPGRALARSGPVNGLSYMRLALKGSLAACAYKSSPALRAAERRAGPISSPAAAYTREPGPAVRPAGYAATTAQPGAGPR